MIVNRITKFAIAYHRRGWQPIPIPYRKKGPTIKDWRSLHLTEREILDRFHNNSGNIGVLMGEPSALIDIDLDCPEAVALAAELLPPTDCTFGRYTKPVSHMLYTGDLNGEKTKQLKGPAGDSLVEFRSDGAQTLLPPSIHSDGTEVVFKSKGKPAHVDIPALLEAVHELAAAALLLRCYPSQGSRHDFALALAGGLLHAGWSVDRVRRYIEVIATKADDDEVEDRIAAVGTTHQAIVDGRETTGWPSVSRIIDGSEPKQQYVARIRRHLGIDRRQAIVVRPAPEPSPIALDTTSTEPYVNSQASMDAINRMAETSRQHKATLLTLAVQIDEWKRRRGKESLFTKIEHPIPYVCAALKISVSYFHRLGQVGRVLRCLPPVDNDAALSEKAIVPLARLLEHNPEAIPKAYETAHELAEADARREGRTKPRPVRPKHTAAAVDDIIGPAPKHTPVRRRPSPDPDTAACEGVREQISELADSVAAISAVPAHVRMRVVELAKLPWSRGR